MWVAPAARASGEGDLLIRTVVKWAREQGAERVTLGVFKSNNRAIALYRRHEFVDVSSIESIDSEGRHERRMMLELGRHH